MIDLFLACWLSLGLGRIMMAERSESLTAVMSKKITLWIMALST